MSRFRIYLGVGALAAIIIVYRWFMYNPDRVLDVDVDKIIEDIRGDNKTLQTNGAMTLFYFSRSPDYKEQLLKKGVVPKVAQLIVGSDLDKTGRPELLGLSIVALANFVEHSQEHQVQALSEGLLDKLLNVIQTGVPAWQLSAMRALTVLAKQPVVRTTMFQNNKEFVSMGLDLLQAGALKNHSDVVMASAGLLGVLMEDPSCRQLMLEPPAPLPALPLLALQIVQSHNSSGLLGPALELVDKMMVVGAMTHQDLVEAGIIHLMVSELRRSNKATAEAVLSLMGRLVGEPAAAGEVVGAGGLSLCLQLFFQKAAEPAWRRTCSDLVSSLAGDQQRVWGAKEVPGPEAARQIIANIITILRESEDWALQYAALEALRDVASQVGPAELMVEVGGSGGALPLLSALLSSNATDISKGEYVEKGWLQQSQRSAALVVALLALHPTLRPQVIAGGLVPALGACVINSKGAGLAAQVRVTAAAALVPLLGDGDKEVISEVLLSGALERLVGMYFSPTPAEKSTAVKVLQIMAKDPAVAEVLRSGNMDEALPGEGKGKEEL